MTSLKKSLIAVAAALCLAGVWLVLTAYDGGNEKTRTDILCATEESIEKIRVTGREGEFTLINTDRGWQADEDTALDTLAVNGFLAAALNIQGDPVEQAPDSEADYGMTDPCSVVEYFYKNGERKKLFLGNKTPTGTEYYISDGKRLFVIYTETGDQLKKDLYSLADTFIFGLDYESIAEINVFGNESFTLKKTDGKWYFNNAAADTDFVKQNVTRHFGGMYARRIYPDNEQNRTFYGISPNGKTVKITDTAGNETTFILGNENEGTIPISCETDKIYSVISDYFAFTNMSENDFKGKE